MMQTFKNHQDVDRFINEVRERYLLWYHLKVKTANVITTITSQTIIALRQLTVCGGFVENSSVFLPATNQQHAPFPTRC